MARHSIPHSGSNLILRYSIAAALGAAVGLAASASFSGPSARTVAIIAAAAGSALVAAGIHALQERQAADQQAQAISADEVFRSAISRLNHKVNNALMVIRGQAEVELRRDPEGPRAEADRRIISQVDLIAGELLELSRLKEKIDLQDRP